MQPIKKKCDECKQDFYGPTEQTECLSCLTRPKRQPKRPYNPLDKGVLMKKCIDCKELFEPTGNRQIRCPPCAEKHKLHSPKAAAIPPEDPFDDRPDDTEPEQQPPKLADLLPPNFTEPAPTPEPQQRRTGHLVVIDLDHFHDSGAREINYVYDDVTITITRKP